MQEKEKQVTLSQVIDLIHAGPEMAALMGQYPQIWDRMPDLCAELETIAGKLDALGINGWSLLRRNARLREVFKYYDCWKDIQKHGRDASGKPLRFTIVSSPLLKQNDALKRIMKKMAQAARMIELSLVDQELRLSSGGLSASFPAQFDEGGTLMVKRGFAKILLDVMSKDEWIQCELDGSAYKINGATYRPPA